MSDLRLDQFYTNSDIAQWCLDKLNLSEYDIILEPSAGSGSFYNLLPDDKRVGLDVAPASPEIKKMNYFDFEPTPGKKYLTVGNPPFGKNSSMAKKFFNRSAEFSDVIAFILPRTFRKASTVNQLNKWFHLREDFSLLSKSFHLPDKTPYDVPCVFQVWERRDVKREKNILIMSSDDFIFLHKTVSQSEADFCVRRVGVKAGNIYEDFNEIRRSRSSHYFIKELKPGVKDTMLRITWGEDSGKYDTAGNPSISKDELIRRYEEEKNRVLKNFEKTLTSKDDSVIIANVNGN